MSDVVTPQAGAIVKQDFGRSEMSIQTETASTAVAAQARAAVESRYKMAIARPRDVDEARIRLLKECRRPGFAAKAVFSKPVGGGKVEGPSIRFAEAAIRMMGNILVETPTIYDDAQKRIVRVVATDLETNATFQSDVVIEKTVERSDSRGREVLRERLNKDGRKVYVVVATEDDLLNKVNALISKAVRTNGLRLLPADILEECLAECRDTMKTKDAKDPDAAKKAVADSFAEISVGPAQLREYLGHELATVSLNELAELRAIYAAIRDGETSWHAVMETKEKTGEVTTSAPPKPAAAPQVAPVAQPAPSPSPAPAAPVPAQAAPAGAPDPVDVFLAELAQVDSTAGVDALSRQVSKVAPHDHPRRMEVGNAMNEARKRVRGAR